jgi:hypothetical protein
VADRAYGALIFCIDFFYLVVSHAGRHERFVLFTKWIEIVYVSCRVALLVRIEGCCDCIWEGLQVAWLFLEWEMRRGLDARDHYRFIAYY